MSYVEQRVASPSVLCTWEQTTRDAREQRVVPDACVDVIWAGRTLTIAGPDTRARVVSLEPGSRLVGVRLRPGAAGRLLGLPASELRDTSPDGAEILGPDAAAALLEELSSGTDAQATLRVAVEARSVQAPDPLVSAAVLALGRPRARVGLVASELGVSARQLQRLVDGAVGYGPKMLQRVLRLQRLRTLAPAPLAELALDAGYADQAHMTSEVTQLAGIPPVRFLKDSAATVA